MSERFCVFANELAAAETIIFVVSERFCVFAGEVAAAETTIFVVSERFCVAFAIPKKRITHIWHNLIWVKQCVIHI